jgi:N-acetylglutamate synthase
MARTLDLALCRAWPAQEEVAIGSWTARLDAGVTRRANSVLPHGAGPPPGTATLDEWLRAAVRLYRDRGLTPWFQLTGAAWPPGLEQELGVRGWETGTDRTLLLTGDIFREEGSFEVRLAPQPHHAWLETWWSGDSRGGATHLGSAAAILARIRGPVAFASVVVGGACAGVALGVLVDGLLVLECVATIPDARRAGVARAAVGELGRWAAAQGATSTLLAVQEANGPALALYEALGLSEAGAYAYARPPVDPPGPPVDASGSAGEAPLRGRVPRR